MTTPVILDGTATAKTIRAEVGAAVKALTAKTGTVPTLAAILAGDDPASQTYVAMKERACARAGMGSRTFPFPNDVSQAEIADCLACLNADPAVHGILVQHPLPKHVDEPAILSLMDPAKDVDGIAPISLGRLVAGLPAFHACTPAGMIELMKRYNLPMAGKHAVVVGRSVILGKPLALLLLQEKRHGHCLPFQNAQLGRNNAAGRHPVRGRRPGRDDYKRHDQAGRGDFRRRLQPCARQEP